MEIDMEKEKWTKFAKFIPDYTQSASAEEIEILEEIIRKVEIKNENNINTTRSNGNIN